MPNHIPIVALVLTYGVPNDGKPDSNYARYATKVVERLIPAILGDETPTIVLTGGETNPLLPDVTEASVMRKAILAYLDIQGIEHSKVKIYEKEKTLDMPGSIELFMRYLDYGPPGNPKVANVFCEIHRRRRVEMIVHTLFFRYGLSRPIITPIDFDGREYGFRDHVARIVETVSAVACVFVPGYYRFVEWPRRMRKIGRDREGKILPR